MNNTMLDYGRLERPGVGKKPDASGRIEDVIGATFTIWHGAFGGPGFWSHELYEKAYAEAAALLEPHKEQLRHLTSRQLHSFMKSVSRREVSFNGIFSSALANASEIDLINAPEDAELSGYRLRKGKVLVIHEPSRALLPVGSYSEGVAVNFGEGFDSLAQFSRGVVVNYGSNVKRFAINALGGVQINAAKYPRGTRFAMGARAGVQINFCDSGTRMAYLAEKGVQANFGRPYQLIIQGAKGGVQANMRRSASGSYLKAWKIAGQNITLTEAAEMFGRNSPKMQRFSELREQLFECLSSVRWVNDDYTGENREEMVARIASFGWQGFEQSATEIGKSLEELVK